MGWVWPAPPKHRGAAVFAVSANVADGEWQHTQRAWGQARQQPRGKHDDER
jgi:hypothetical protein